MYVCVCVCSAKSVHTYLSDRKHTWQLSIQPTSLYLR